jgi:dienelactone hydrolase
MKISRREVMEKMGAVALAARLPSLGGALTATETTTNVLAGTDSFTLQGDIAAQMVAGIHMDLQKRTDASVAAREALWNRDFSGRAAYEASVAANRKRFGQRIGLIDARVKDTVPVLEMRVGDSRLAGSGDGYKIYNVRWPVLEGVEAEGLLLEPDRPPAAQVVALPDADWEPEALAGLRMGVPAAAQYARRLAENGCRVLVPVLINRDDAWSGNDQLGIRTNLTHREFIYRMAFEMGRHVIGYEVQKVLAAVDWFRANGAAERIGVMGYGEGGLLALYSAACDLRIDAVCVSGYFASRQRLWQEPLYRNVWGLLEEFGDAELAGLVAPRTLVVEAARGPEIAGPPAAGPGRRNSAASGSLTSPSVADVCAEAERARHIYEKLHARERLVVIESDEGRGEPGSETALREFLGGLGVRAAEKSRGSSPAGVRTGFDPAERARRQFDQLVNFTQEAIRESDAVREGFWAGADRSSLDAWMHSTERYRRSLWEDVLGKLPAPAEMQGAQSRINAAETRWTEYEIFLPLWEQVFAYGVLLLPHGIRADERRPVVVCQHGLEETPQDLIRAGAGMEGMTHNLAAQLVSEGFVVFCPQTPTRGDDAFRKLQRMANPLRYSLHSYILSQHQRVLEWLAAQPFADPKRIALYGFSYGGKTVMRAMPLLDGYAACVCDGDFNEWIGKVARNDAPFTYLFTPEYEVNEFNLGNTFDHSDMANLMTPQPFLVGRGHDDGVSYDSWVAYEFAKVRRHYDQLGLEGGAQVEFFNGPHQIHAAGTVEFLRRRLNWSARS